jgi:hypothetical protein
MKKKYTFLLLFISHLTFSQSEKLFFYVEKDSLVGVRNQNREIIIYPKPTWNSPSYYNKREIKSALFNLDFKDKPYCYYDRNGKFIFKTFMTSEGPDSFQEGFIRYSENKKSGLISDKGQKITAAKYDWVSPINFGFASFCNGCYWDTSKDEEHPPLVGGVWGFVDRSGKEIIPSSERNHPKDFETKDHTFIPYQFVYDEKEKHILEFFENRKDKIAKINGFNCKENILYFEIVGRPSEFESFYKIKTFELCDFQINAADENYDDYKNFKVSADGKNYYVLYNDLVNYKEYSEYVERKIPVDKWIKENLNK